MAPQPIPAPAPGALTLLGIETSCDETAASVVRRWPDGRCEVLSSVISSQIAAHAPYGGVVPEIAARAHVESIDAIIAQAMGEAGWPSPRWTGSRPRPGRASSEASWSACRRARPSPWPWISP